MIEIQSVVCFAVGFVSETRLAQIERALVLSSFAGVMDRAHLLAAHSMLSLSLSQ